MGGSFVTAWSEVVAIAGRQHGVVSFDQLIEAGLTPRAVERAVEAGRLHRLHVGVYAVGHVPATRHARWMAAVLACGPGAVLSHRSAATLWRIREAETSRTDVTIPPGSGRRRPAIAIHRSPLDPHDRTSHQGIPVTTPERTIIDVATQVDPDDTARAIREAQYRRHLHIPSMQRALDRRPSRTVQALIHDQMDTRSRLEDDFMRLLDRHGIPRPLTQEPVLGHRVDFLWPAEKLVVETDGWEGHGTRTAFQLDRSLTNRMQLAGYLVLRLTDADVSRRSRATARLIREALGRR